MKQKPTVSLPLRAMLLCGLLCTLLLFGLRLAGERQETQVAAAIRWTDAQTLSARAELSPEEWLRPLRAAGLQYLLLETEPDAALLRLMEQLGLAYGGDGTAMGGCAFVLPREDAPLTERFTPLALAEELSRRGVLRPAEFDPEEWSGLCVKTLYLYPSYADRCTAAEGTQPVEDLLCRAVVDRGMRLLILTPLSQGQEAPFSDPERYASLLSGVSARLAARGLTLGQGFSCVQAKTRLPLCWAAFWLTAALWIGLAETLLPRLRPWEGWLCLAAAVLSGALLWLRPVPALKLFALLCAVIFPLWLILALAKALSAPEKNARPLWRLALGGLAAVLGWSLLGGMSVSALLSARSFALGCTVFSGVKLAQGAPLLAALGLLLWLLRRELKQAGLRRAIPVAALLALAGVLVAVRSGDSSLSLGLEDTLRLWLERTLYVRPRTKELLAGVPCALCLLPALRQSRRQPWIGLAVGLGACLECVSVINTFCHGTAPLWSSLVRTLLAAGLGLLPGAALLLCLLLLQRYGPAGRMSQG